MEFLKGVFRPSKTTYRFEEHGGNVGHLLLPQGVYQATTERGRDGRVTHVEDANVQHALVRPNTMRAEVRIRHADIRTHIMDIIREIRESRER